MSPRGMRGKGKRIPFRSGDPKQMSGGKKTPLTGHSGKFLGGGGRGWKNHKKEVKCSGDALTLQESCRLQKISSSLFGGRGGR